MQPDSILDELCAWLTKYMVFPNPHIGPVMALWIAHSYAADSFYTTPRLVFSSPVPGSGKTRALELIEGVAHAPIMTTNASTAALYRTIAAATKQGKTPPTLLYDEVDALFGKRATPQSEEVRALLNAGYKRGAHVLRCEGDATSMEVVEFPVFAPVALAGLAGHMPDTITTRAIVVELKKRRSGEPVEPYRERRARAEIGSVRTALSDWVNSIRPSLTEAAPSMPAGVEDRPAEVWEPLLAIADAAGGRWPTIAREACHAIVFAPSRRPPSLGVELLSDIRDVMAGTDRIATKALIQELRDKEEAPWKDLDGGRGLTARRLAQLLAGYSVRSVTFTDPTTQGSRKGYVTYPTVGKAEQAGLADAWGRYLPSDAQPRSEKSGTSGTPVTTQVESPDVITPLIPDSVIGNAEVTDCEPLTSKVTDMTEVPDFPDHAGGTVGSNGDRDTEISTPAPGAGDSLTAELLTFFNALAPDDHLDTGIVTASFAPAPADAVATRLDHLVGTGHLTRTARGYARAERSAS